MGKCDNFVILHGGKIISEHDNDKFQVHHIPFSLSLVFHFHPHILFAFYHHIPTFIGLFWGMPLVLFIFADLRDYPKPTDTSLFYEVAAVLATYMTTGKFDLCIERIMHIIPNLHENMSKELIHMGKDIAGSPSSSFLPKETHLFAQLWL